MNPNNGYVTGVLYMIAFSVIAPGIDVFAKLATETMSAGVISLARFTIQSVLLGGFVLILRAPMAPVADLPRHFARGALIAAATLLFVMAIRFMPIADAIAIFFVEPVFVTLLSALILGEQVGWRRYSACLVGFAGAMLVIQPSFEEVGVPALYPLGTAFCFSFYLLLTRSLSQRTNIYVMQFLAGVSGLLVIAVALVIGDGGPVDALHLTRPIGVDWTYLAAVGVFATFSHILIVLALRAAPASVVAPVQYLEIVAATLYGLWVFGDFPNAVKWVGIGIVVASGLFILHRERLAQRQSA